MKAISKKRLRAGVLAGVLVTALPFLLPARAQGEPAPAAPARGDAETTVRRGELFSMFQDVEVPRGELRAGEVVCLFGDVRIDGEVDGEVVVVGGNVTVSGKIRDELVAVLSNVVLEESAEIGSDLVNVGGTLDDRSGRIGGDRVNIPVHLGPLRLRSPFGVIGALITWGALIWLVLAFILVVILTAVAPERVRLLSAEAPSHLLLAYLTGLGGYVALLIVNALLISTVIGIPLAFLLYVAFLLLKWLGLAGIYHHVGRGLGRLFGREISLLGGVLLGFLPFAALLVLPPVIGGIALVAGLVVRLLFWLAVEIPAVGLVILTAAGSRPRVRAAWPTPPVAPPPGPSSPLPPPANGP